jgi:Tfp pilus assembly protein PilN
VRVNLLPPEIYERQRIRRRTGAVVAVGLIVLMAIGAFYFLQVVRLNEVEDDVSAQEARNADLQSQINELQDIAALETEIAATRGLLNDLLADRVLWSGVLRDVSLVIPGEVWLNGLTGSVGAPAAGETTTTTTVTPTTPGVTGGIVGQITFNGNAFEHTDVALWLTRLEDVRGFINPWLTSSTKTLIGTNEVVQFNSSVDLSEQALARRAGGD